MHKMLRSIGRLSKDVAKFRNKNKSKKEESKSCKNLELD